MPIFLDTVSPRELSKPAIKLALFDIDGTILDLEGQFPSALKEEMMRIQQLGIKTAVASGRPWFASRFVYDELALHAPGVFCTGAHIFDPVTGRSLASRTLNGEVCRELLTHLRRLNIYYEVYTTDNFYYETEVANAIRSRHAQLLRHTPQWRLADEILVEEGVYKFILAVDQDVDGGVLESLERDFPQLIFAYAGLPGYPSWTLANVVDQQASKRQAFSDLLDYHQVTADQVIAFGDSHSDIEFLRMAGTGVAMGNAKEPVQQAANYVTLPVGDNGLAYALSRLL